MIEYKTVSGEIENTIIINRSKFITTIKHIENSEDAVKFVADIRKKYYDATHNVYCYIADINVNEIRFSDDGEPQGTSAQPALEVLKKRNIVKVIAIVTRYFGGIKLGSNGLISAYSRSVTEALDKAVIKTFKLSNIIKFNIDYSLSRVINNVIKENEIKIINKDFQDVITYEIAIPKTSYDEIIIKLKNITLGNIKTEFLREEYIDY